MAQAKTKPRANQNLLSLMRELRKVLPGNVEKLSTTEYLVAERAEVTLNYYCRWDKADLAERAKTCHPGSITIAANVDKVKELLGSSSRTPSRGAVFHTRTIAKRRDGTFNVESVAVAVTKCIEAVDNFVRESKAHQLKQAADKRDFEKELLRVGKLLPKAGFNRNYDGFSSRKSPGLAADYVHVRVSKADEGGYSYSLDINDINEATLMRVLTALKG
jgi:hypothetical protein